MICQRKKKTRKMRVLLKNCLAIAVDGSRRRRATLSHPNNRIQPVATELGYGSAEPS
jgi:hypothetical protein